MNRRLDKIRARVRALAYLLGHEEEADLHLKNWRSRKEEHDNLLEKLYQLEKRQ